MTKWQIIENDAQELFLGQYTIEIERRKGGGGLLAFKTFQCNRNDNIFSGSPYPTFQTVSLNSVIFSYFYLFHSLILLLFLFFFCYNPMAFPIVVGRVIFRMKKIEIYRRPAILGLDLIYTILVWTCSL